MIHRFRGLWVGLVGIVVLGGVGSASGDVLHMKKGGRLEGVLTRETPSTITIDVGMGQVSVPRSTVDRIERKESALSEYRSRLGLVGPGDIGAYTDLARFASRSGLGSESRAMWGRVLSLDPGNVEAHLALKHVLAGGRYVDEEEAYRENGFVYFDGRWMTPAEQSSLLREREQRAIDDRRVDEARRAAREAEDRARRAEAEAARARAAAAATTSVGYPVWGYGSAVLVGSPHWGGYSVGCSGVACSTPPVIWPALPPRPIATPLPVVVPPRPASWR